MLSWLMPWLKFWPLALAIATFIAGWTVCDWRQGSKQAATEAKQIVVDSQATKQTNALIGQEQASLTPIWKSSLETSNQWSVYEAKNPTGDCNLPATAIELRNRAAAATYPARAGADR